MIHATGGGVDGWSSLIGGTSSRTIADSVSTVVGLSKARRPVTSS